MKDTDVQAGGGKTSFASVVIGDLLRWDGVVQGPGRPGKGLNRRDGDGPTMPMCQEAFKGVQPAGKESRTRDNATKPLRLNLQLLEPHLFALKESQGEGETTRNRRNSNMDIELNADADINSIGDRKERLKPGNSGAWDQSNAVRIPGPSRGTGSKSVIETPANQLSSEVRSDSSEQEEEGNAREIGKGLNDNFGNLRSLLKALFLFQMETLPISHLNTEEIVLLTCVLDKKFGVALPTLNIYALSDFSLVESNKISKRPEECYKFVFKYAFKQLKKRFARKNPRQPNIKAQGFIQKFYSHHFGEASQSTKLPLNNFYLPLSPEAYPNKKHTVLARTINGWYVALLAQSPAFMAELVEFINKDLLDCYKRQIEVKIDNLCNRWERIFRDSGENYRVIEAIQDDIFKSIRCKLPWTVKEVEFAIDMVNRLIKKYKHKGLGRMKSFATLADEEP